MAEPVSQRLTYDDLLQMPDDGPRYELIDGEAYVIPGPDAKHQTALLQLAIQLHNAIRDRSRVFIAPFDVVLAMDTVLQPDVLLLAPASLARIKRSLHGPPDLAVELLSPTIPFSIRRDRGIKLATYARFGVGEYWLMDLNQQAIEVYRLVAGTPPSYRLEGNHLPGDRVTTPLLPDLALDPAALFPDLS